MRDDEPRPSYPTEDILANAPKSEADFFRVRAVLE
jgi:Asp-tRNA(Asn)/Glu-tRNA(Gln) amidotransferase C subunit